MVLRMPLSLCVLIVIKLFIFNVSLISVRGEFHDFMAMTNSGIKQPGSGTPRGLPLKTLKHQISPHFHSLRKIVWRSSSHFWTALKSQWLSPDWTQRPEFSKPSHVACSRYIKPYNYNIPPLVNRRRSYSHPENCPLLGKIWKICEGGLKLASVGQKSPTIHRVGAIFSWGWGEGRTNAFGPPALRFGNARHNPRFFYCEGWHRVLLRPLLVMATATKRQSWIFHEIPIPQCPEFASSIVGCFRFSVSFACVKFSLRRIQPRVPPHGAESRTPPHAFPLPLPRTLFRFALLRNVSPFLFLSVVSYLFAWFFFHLSLLFLHFLPVV